MKKIIDIIIGYLCLFLRVERKKHVSYKPIRNTQIIDSPEVAVKLFRQMWNKKLLTEQEEVYVIFVNEEYVVANAAHLHIGGVHTSVVDMSVLFKLAYMCNAKGIFLAHNHPNGSTKPSQLDKDITREINNLCGKLSFTLHDHIILTEEKYYSFSEGRMLG